MVQTSYLFQVDDVYKNDCEQQLQSDVFAPYMVAIVSTMCALLVIDLDLFNFLIDNFELGQKVNA